MNYSSFARNAYLSAVDGAHDCDCHTCGSSLHAIMEVDLASYADTLREREADLWDLYSESSPRRRSAQQQHNIERLKEEIGQLHDTIRGLETDLVNLCSYTPSSPSHLPDRDGPFNVYDDSDPDDKDDHARDEWEDYHDPAMDLWSSESPGGMGSEAEGERMPSRNVNDAELESLPTLMCFGMRIVKGDEERLEDTTTPQLVTPQSTSRQKPTSSSSRRISQSYCEETPVEEVRRKMQRATVPGQDEVLAHVKYLVTQAHRTPAHLRTDAQKVLLLDWRRPPPPPPRVVGRPSVDAYVDACSYGIGFHLGELWQSWRLKPCWRGVMGANTQWSEAVAIELGLRLLIKAGFASRRIVMYSDNTGAVDAIQFGNTRRPLVGQVVECIDYLCEEYRLDFSVKWIRGVHNPADAPSRLLMRDERQRFPHDIDIPVRLGHFIAPY